MNNLHYNLQMNALNKAVKKLIPFALVSYPEVKERKLYLELDSIDFNEKKSIIGKLPTREAIIDLAKKYYRFFDDNFITNVEYIIVYAYDEAELFISAGECDVRLTDNWFSKVDINGANNILIQGDILKGQDINLNISAESIEIEDTSISTDGYVILDAKNTKFENTKIYSSILNIYSNSIDICHSKFLSNFSSFNTDKIIARYSEIKSNKEIKINNKNCDAIEGVDAPKIIYNDVDITNSDGIVKPKLIKNLIADLKELREKVLVNIEEELKVENEKLENKKIKKILKKNPNN